MMVIFDLDDTLYKERDFVKSGNSAVAKYITEHNLPLATKDKWDDNMLKVYREHWPNINLDSETTFSLQMLKDKGINIGLITDGRLTTQINKVEALGLYRWIEKTNIIISEALGHDKTTPFPFLEMMSHNPEEKDFIYIGDNPTKDFHYPNILGWKSIMLKDIDHINIHTQDMPEDCAYHPQIIIENLKDYILTI